MKWEPADTDYQDILQDTNPWHTLGKVPREFARPRRRSLAELLWQVVLYPRMRRHQIILGPRRVGKTTVMYQTVEKLLSEGTDPRRLWWLGVDHPLFLDVPLGKLVKLLLPYGTTKDPVFLFLDELTYAERWDLWLKTIYDERWPVRIVGTSSATAALLRRGRESGVGRWDEQHLAPYQFTEYLDLKQIPFELETAGSLRETLNKAIQTQRFPRNLADHRRRFMLTGGFPELLDLEPSDDETSDVLRSQRILRSDAIEKAVYKDIPQTFDIQDPVKLERLLYTLAGQVTGLFSATRVAGDVQLTSPTVERYAKFLEWAFLIFSLPNYAPREETVQRRGRKLYFVDGAVRNAALLRGLGPLSDPAEMGLLVENLAASHLFALSQQSSVRLYHWRRGKEEIDFVYDHPKEPLAFEVEISPSHPLKNLVAFEAKFPKFQGSCYFVCPDVEPRKAAPGRPGRIPLDLLLIAVGCQAQRALEQRLGVEKKKGEQPAK